MAKSKKKSGKHKGHGRKKRARKRRPGKAAVAQAHAVKATMDRAAAEMKRMAAKCNADIRRAKASATRAAKSGGKKRKPRKTSRKKTAHHHHHAKHSGTVSAAALLRGAAKGRKAKATRGMPKALKRWTCEAPVRTGCGGGARGGHVADRVR
jgi:hypothetical protein